VVISLASGGDGPSYLLALNPTARDAPVRWPPAPWPQPELVVLDTTADDPTAEAPVPSVSPARSVLLVRTRAGVDERAGAALSPS